MDVGGIAAGAGAGATSLTSGTNIAATAKARRSKGTWIVGAALQTVFFGLGLGVIAVLGLGLLPIPKLGDRRG